MKNALALMGCLGLSLLGWGAETAVMVVTPDRINCRYEVGETAQLTVCAEGTNGVKLARGVLSVKVDNFGNRDPHVITWDDDSHVLPFDGTVDFRWVGAELNRLSFNGVLMIELGRSGAIPWYNNYKAEEWLAEAHTRIMHLNALCE